MTQPLPQGAELAWRAREAQEKLQTAQHLEAQSQQRLRSFAERALPSSSVPDLEPDQTHLGPPLPETMVQCIGELKSLHPAKQFTEALMVGPARIPPACGCHACHQLILSGVLLQCSGHICSHPDTHVEVEGTLWTCLKTLEAAISFWWLITLQLLQSIEVLPILMHNCTQGVWKRCWHMHMHAVHCDMNSWASRVF